MTGAVECRYYGRDFTVEEMALLRALIAAEPPPTRAALSREFCRRIGWLKPDAGLKDMMARVAMLAMHRDGMIALPPPRGPKHRPKPIVFGPDTEPPLFPAPTSLDEVRPLDMHTVVRETREGRLWNEFVARYHYLGYKTLVGSQMRYAVHDRNGWPLAMLGFSTAAWKLAPRDHFIGWTPELREKNLPLVVDNPRFLILPWVEIPNLGSHLLAIVRRRLPIDWTERYRTTPVLIETFVENAPIHRRRLPGLRLAPRRNHPRPGALRPRQTLRQAPQGRLAPAPPTRLAAHPQSVKPSLSSGCVFSQADGFHGPTEPLHAKPFDLITRPTALQRKAFKLLGVRLQRTQ